MQNPAAWHFLFRCILALIALGLLLGTVRGASADAALAQTCATCHGKDGISANGLWPNLAGQKEGYLANAIRQFRDGVRIEPTMQPFVQTLSEDEINSLATFYSNLPPKAYGGNRVNKAGERVRAYCISCHGMEGRPVNTEWPTLTGQKSAYLEKQLLAFKSGSRQGPIMNVIAQELTDQQIRDVAEYYSLR